MKNLFVGLLILSSLASCGKSNTVGGSSAAPLAAAAAVSPLTVTGTVETQLAQIVDANQFGLGQAGYSESWAQYIARLPDTTYNYGTYTAGQNDPNCKTYLVIIQVCSSSSFSNSTVAVTRSVKNSSVLVPTKQNEIKAIINRRSMVQSAGNGVFYIKTTDNNMYIIDQKLPIQANPVQTTSATGTGETLVSVQ